MTTVSDSFEDIVSVLADFLQKHRAYYLRCEPEIHDFRPRYAGAIGLYGAGGEGVQFQVPDDHFNTFVGLLLGQVFGEDRVVFTWDVKKLFSYLAHRVPRSRPLGVAAKVIDIQYGEAFLGDRGGKAPASFEEAKRRARPVAQSEACRAMQARVEIPLATRVLPKVETYGFRDAEDRMVKHSVYQIGGQRNGRLKCQPLDGGVYAHGLSAADRGRFRPAQDNVFAEVDFKAMEVCVLQWLSEDPRLTKIIESGRDIYSTIYSLLYGQKAGEKQRDFIKEAFLPIVFGAGVPELAARVGTSQDEAATLVKKVHGFFDTAIDWVQSHQDRLRVDPVMADRFGRLRRYEDDYHKVRNQVIQGPAATVCLDKLVSLYDRLYKSCEIVATIHDAYILDVPRRQLYDVVYYATETLQAPSEIAPGLHLKVDVKVGLDLGNLQPFNI